MIEVLQEKLLSLNSHFIFVRFSFFPTRFENFVRCLSYQSILAFLYFNLFFRHCQYYFHVPQVGNPLRQMNDSESHQNPNQICLKFISNVERQGVVGSSVTVTLRARE